MSRYSNRSLSNRKRWGWIPGVLICLGVTCLSHRPVEIPDVLDISHQDKIIHALVYGLIATTFLRWLRSFKKDLIAGTWAIIIASLFGISDELHQYFVPGRTMDILDWFADTFGAILATVCYLKWPLYQSILEWPQQRPS